MAKLLIILILCCLSLTIVSASPLTSDINISTLNLIKGANKEVKLNITNPGNQSLVDVKIEGEFVTSSIVNRLDPNQTKEITLTFNTQSIGTLVRNYKIIGFNEVSCNILSSNEKLINITSTGANPRDTQICIGSNVRFQNSYGNSVRVVLTDFSVDTNIADGSSLVQSYPNAGTFVYRIEPLIDLGNIKVDNTIQKVHNANNDGSFTLSLNSQLQETNIDITLETQNFSMSHNEIINSFFIVKNNGSTSAENLRFFGYWLSFDKNNIDINSNGQRAVNFVLAPEITSTEQTNKTYTKEIIIVGDNIAEKRVNLTIFIKSSNVVGGNISTPEWWQRRLEFCNAFPSSPDCITEPIIVLRDKEIFDCPAILANVSPSHLQESLQECSNLRGDFSSLSNNLKLNVDNIKELALGAVNRDKELNSSLAINVERIEGFRDTFYTLFGIIFLVSIGGGVGYVALIYYKRRKESVVGSY